MRFIKIALIFLLVLSLASCGKKTEISQDIPDVNSSNEHKSTHQSTFEVVQSEFIPKVYYQQEYFADTSHENSKISIKYPKFTDADMQPINEAVFEFVSELAEELYDDDYKDLQLELDFTVQRYDSKYLSISFCGTGNVHTAAHPNNILVTQNFDLTTKKRIVLSDVCKVDISFAELVKQKISEQYSADINSQFSDIKKFLELLKDCDTDINGCQSYLTEQGITVCLPVAHAVGDYIEVDL